MSSHRCVLARQTDRTVWLRAITHSMSQWRIFVLVGEVNELLAIAVALKRGQRMTKW